MKKSKEHSTALRKILYLLFGVSIFIPVCCILIIIPSYFRTQMSNENIENIEGNLMLVSEQILTYLSDIQQIIVLAYSDPSFADLLTDPTDNPRVIELSQEKILLNSIKLLKNDIKSIILLAPNGNVVYFHRNANAKLNEDYDFSTFLDMDSLEETIYIGAHNPQYFTDDGNTKVFSMVRRIGHPYIDKDLGTIIIDADDSMFEDIFRSIDMKDDTISLLMDNVGHVLYSSESLDEMALNAIRVESSRIDIDGIRYKVIQKKVPIGEWKIAVLLSDESINRSIYLVYRVGIITSLLTILLTYALFNYLSTHLLLKPIKDMAKVLKEVERGNLNVSFKSSYRNEITQLGENVNVMIDKLKILIEQGYKMEITQKQAEYRALQSRIKPHFLYNTLNCLAGLNRIGERSKLENAINDMTSMMRYSLSDSEKGLSTIRDEIAFIIDYERLEKLRFEEKLDFSLDVDKRVEDAVIPKMLIQPLVENSIVHNVEKSDRPVKVIVSVTYLESDNMISITVKDHGFGFDINAKNLQGIGLKNVQQRIRYWNTKGSCNIESVIKEGTTVNILIPFIKDQKV